MRLRIGMWWRVLLVTGMLYVTVLTILDAARAAGVDWRGGYLAVAICLLPVETYLSRRTVKRRELRGDDLTRFKLAEAVVVLLALMLLRFLWQGVPNLGGKVERLFDAEYLFSAAVTVTYWSLASYMIGWFEELEYQPSEKAPPVTSPEFDLWVSSRARHVQHTAAFQRILAMFLAGGVFILVVAGMARVDPSAIIDFRRGTIRLLIGHVIVYFVLGLALVAEARLSLLHTRWQHEEVSVAPSVARRWPLFVAALLLLSALVALVLPVDYSVGLLDAIARVIGYFIAAVMAIMYFLFFILGYLLYPLRWLMAQGRGEAPPPPPEFAPPQESAPASGPAPPFLDVLKTLVLWLIAIGIVVYALYNFAREHGASLSRFPLLRPLLRLVLALGDLVRRLARGARRASRRLAQRAARRRQAAREAAGRGPLLRLGRLGPRELVQYYYLSTVRRAQSAGLPRRANQTPDEYSRGLASNLPEESGDVGALTEAFVEARYSPHPIGPERARGLRPYWQRVREALRRLRRGKTEITG